MDVGCLFPADAIRIPPPLVLAATRLESTIRIPPPLVLATTRKDRNETSRIHINYELLTMFRFYPFQGMAAHGQRTRQRGSQ